MSPGATPDGSGGAVHPSTSDGVEAGGFGTDGAPPTGAPADGLAADGAPAGGASAAAADAPRDHPDDQAVTDPVTESETSARAERRRRLQALAGVTVHGSDGTTVGRVRDIYQQDATGELAAITVMPRQLSAHSVLIPASAIAALPDMPEESADPSADADAQTAGAPLTDKGIRKAEKDARKAEKGSRRAEKDTTQAEQRSAAPDSTEQVGDHVLHLLVDAATAKAGARPPLTLHATPQDLREAAAALHLEEGYPRA